MNPLGSWSRRCRFRDRLVLAEHVGAPGRLARRGRLEALPHLCSHLFEYLPMLDLLFGSHGPEALETLPGILDETVRPAAEVLLPHPPSSRHLAEDLDFLGEELSDVRTHAATEHRQACVFVG